MRLCRRPVLFLFTLMLVPGFLCAQARVQRNVLPGNPLVATFIGNHQVRALLEDESGTVIATADSFAVDLVPGVAVGCLIVGVDTRVSPGDYLLRLVASDPPSEDVHPVSILPREFRKESIPLSGTLTELRSSDDPRKADEARLLQALTAEFNPEAVLHTRAFTWPVELIRRTSFFGDRRIYLYSDGDTAPSIHVGLDLAARTGTPVVSSGAGRVRMARYRIVTGNTVVVEHLPGVFSLYYHLSDMVVEEGDRVDMGQPLGAVGATGLATGPHLHWEFRIGGVSVDPEAVLPGLLVDFDR